jgi:hypothetical protein
MRGAFAAEVAGRSSAAQVIFLKDGAGGADARLTGVKVRTGSLARSAVNGRDFLAYRRLLVHGFLKGTH